jgi:hypothetical protein
MAGVGDSPIMSDIYGLYHSLNPFAEATPRDAATQAAYAAPGLGNALSAKDAADSLRVRDYLGAGLGALGAVPLMGGVMREARAARMMDNPNFAKWFTDPVHGMSKAVDADGIPTKVYHGSNAEREVIEPGRRDPGAWFTDDLSNAANYARGRDAYIHGGYIKAHNPFVVDFDSNMQPMHEGKPLTLYDRYGETLEDPNNVDIVNHAKRAGYDSVQFPNGNFTESGNTWVVFSPNQFKSADNIGTFDLSDPRHMYGVGALGLGLASQDLNNGK